MKKLSEIILEMINPFSHIYRQRQERAEPLVVLALIAWNKSVLSEEVGEELIFNFLDKVADPESLEISKAILNQFTNYKQKYYKDDRRFIFSYDLEIDGNNITLNIKSGTVGEGKFDVNAPCPCGSGKIFMKCCGKSRSNIKKNPH